MIRISGKFYLASVSPLLKSAIRGYIMSPLNETTLELSDYDKVYSDSNLGMFKLVDTTSHREDIYLQVKLEVLHYYYVLEEVKKDEIPTTAEWVGIEKYIKRLGLYPDCYLVVEKNN